VDHRSDLIAERAPLRAPEGEQRRAAAGGHEEEGLEFIFGADARRVDAVFGAGGSSGGELAGEG
jgi:hypothetical protein